MDHEYDENSIMSLDPVEHLRLRPQIYFEECFETGSLDIMVFETLCHALDEYFDGMCSRIELTFSKDAFRVKYNAGISLNKPYVEEDITVAETIFTIILTCSNLKKHLEVGDEFCRRGIAFVQFA